jgi:hypothetical protein
MGPFPDAGSLPLLSCKYQCVCMLLRLLGQDGGIDLAAAKVHGGDVVGVPEPAASRLLHQRLADGVGMWIIAIHKTQSEV